MVLTSGRSTAQNEQCNAGEPGAVKPKRKYTKRAEKWKYTKKAQAQAQAAGTSAPAAPVAPVSVPPAEGASAPADQDMPDGEPHIQYLALFAAQLLFLLCLAFMQGLPAAMDKPRFVTAAYEKRTDAVLRGLWLWHVPDTPSCCLAAAPLAEQADLATQQEEQQHQSQQEAAEPTEQEPEPDQAEEEPEQASPQPAARAPKRKQSVKTEPAEEAPRLQRRARKRNAAVAAAIEAEEWKSDADEENSEEEAGRVLS